MKTKKLPVPQRAGKSGDRAAREARVLAMLETLRLRRPVAFRKMLIRLRQIAVTNNSRAKLY